MFDFFCSRLPSISKTRSVFIEPPIECAPLSVESKKRFLQLRTQWDYLHTQYQSDDYQEQLKALSESWICPEFQEKIQLYKDSLSKMQALVGLFERYLEEEEGAALLNNVPTCALNEIDSLFYGGCAEEISSAGDKEDTLPIIWPILTELERNLSALCCVSQDAQTPFWTFTTLFAASSFITLGSACASLGLGLGVFSSIGVFLSVLSSLSFCLSLFRIADGVTNLGPKWKRHRWDFVRKTVKEMECLLTSFENLAHRLEKQQKDCKQSQHNKVLYALTNYHSGQIQHLSKVLATIIYIMGEFIFSMHQIVRDPARNRRRFTLMAPSYPTLEG